MSNDNPDYKVGNCKPPRETQWKPGQSGNPNGRKPGSRNLRAIFLRAAYAEPDLNKVLYPNPESTRIDQVMRRLFDQAMNGNLKAIRQTLDLCQALMPASDETAAPDATEDADSTPCKPDGNG